MALPVPLNGQRNVIVGVTESIGYLLGSRVPILQHTILTRQTPSYRRTEKKFKVPALADPVLRMDNTSALNRVSDAHRWCS